MTSPRQVFPSTAVHFTSPQTGPCYTTRSRWLVKRLTKKLKTCSKVKEEISPLGSLLVQHTVPAVLAANLIAALQGNTRRALAAEIDDGGAVDGHGAAEAAIGAEGVLGAHRGDLVGFTGHDCGGVWLARMCAKQEL